MTHRSPAPTTGPTTAAQDFLAGILAALMPLGAGMLALVGYLWMNVFGVILGLGAAVGWGYWWYTKHHALFPKDLRGGSVGGIAVLVVLLAGIFFLAL